MERMMPIAGESLAALLLAVWTALILGKPLIGLLRRFCREPNKSPSPELEALHASKDATPTLGGLLVFIGAAAAWPLLDGSAPILRLALALAAGLFGLGALDDVIKLATSRRGLSSLSKLAGQFVVVGTVMTLTSQVLADQPHIRELYVPGIGYTFAWGKVYWLWSVVVIVASANAVNVTDGLDGLASGCTLCTILGLGVSGLLLTDPTLAAQLGREPCASVAALLPLLAAVGGGLLGFLFYNRHPAQVFLGDAGALPLGGLLGYFAVVTQQEAWLLVMGSVLIVELASSTLQIATIRLWGKRIFRCAPLHHHFQFAGISEPIIVRRFWMASALCCLLGLGTLLGLLSLPRPGRDAATIVARQTRGTPVTNR